MTSAVIRSLTSPFGRHVSVGPRFFVSCEGAHLELHSFPTRRSSDLLFLAPERQAGVDQEGDPETEEPGVVVRSEEHTSELQSRQYLVCRLLPEKKNLAGRRTTRTGRSSVSFAASPPCKPGG